MTDVVLGNNGKAAIEAAIESGGGGSADFGAIAEDVLPATDDTYDLGSQAKRWADAWFSEWWDESTPASGDSGWTGGTQRVAKYEVIDDSAHGNGLWNVIRIGANDGPLDGELVFDPFWNVALLSNKKIIISGNPYEDWIGGSAGKQHGQYTLGGVSFHSADNSFNADLSLSALTLVDNGSVPTKRFYVDVDNASLNLLGLLPASDPLVAGTAWQWTGDITALTSYLAGGGRLMALGNPA